MTAHENAATANYVFSPSAVQSFLDAKLFGAPLAASINSSAAQLAAYTGDVTRLDVAVVAIPLMLIACVTTHSTARAAMARSAMAGSTIGETSGQSPAPRITLWISRAMLWVLPVGVLVGGPFLPVAILVYWLSNNVWTLAQQHVVNRLLDREE